MEEDKITFPFSHIQPFKIGAMCGIPIVKKMVSDEVEQAIELLNIKDAILEDISGKTYLLIPGHAPYVIFDKWVEDIKQWCQSFGYGKRITFKLHPEAYKYVKNHNKS